MARIAQARICGADHAGSQEPAVPGSSQGINQAFQAIQAFYFVEFRAKLRLGDAF
jgi:hypothetical protein